jgi:hypothetical protein
MAVITGPRGTNTILSDQRKIELGGAISLQEPESNPLTLLSRAMGKEMLGDPVYNWLEDDSDARFDAINNGGGYSSSATSIVVDNGAYFAEHDIWQNTVTKENIRVQSVTSNTLTVVRGVGTTAAAMTDNDELYKIGTAQPEGDTSKPARSSNPTKSTNRMQIQREPWEITGTAMSSQNQTSPHDWDHQKKKHAIEFAKNIELTSWLGGSSEDTSGSQPRRTTKGVIPSITTNVTDAAGALSETEFQTFQRQFARYGGRNRQFFAAALLLGVINNFAQGKLQLRQGEDTYGLAVTHYVSPFGRLDAIYHPLFEGATYGGYGVALDMSQIKYCYLGGGPGGSRDVHEVPHIEENDRDGRKDELRVECGVKLGHEKYHGKLIGVTS